jgi:hypothetical protein
MIKYTRKLRLSDYFIGMLFRVTYSTTDKVMFCLDFILTGIFLFLGLYLPAIILLLLPVFTIILIPLFKYFYAIFYFNIKEGTYFFDTNEFGFDVGSSKVVLNAKNIESIKSCKNWVIIKHGKYIFPFPAENDGTLQEIDNLYPSKLVKN